VLWGAMHSATRFQEKVLRKTPWADQKAAALLPSHSKELWSSTTSALRSSLVARPVRPCMALFTGALPGRMRR